LIVDVARRLDRALIVVGDGPELGPLRSIAGPRTQFLGHVCRERLVWLFQGCSAYVVPGEEDFGIAPVEAQAAGKPVVAFRAGGATETVVDGVTGTFFDRQTPQALTEAIERLDSLRLDRAMIRANAERFAPGVFRSKIVASFERLRVDPELYQSR
jgi:glycosyltransferase involved in cell wall biosynthesis